MNRKYIQDYQMLAKVVAFTTNNVSLFPKTSAASEILAALDSAVTKLSDQDRNQVSSETAMRVSQHAPTAARNALKKRVVLSGQIARVLNCDHFRECRPISSLRRLSTPSSGLRHRFHSSGSARRTFGNLPWCGRTWR